MHTLVSLYHFLSGIVKWVVITFALLKHYLSHSMLYKHFYYQRWNIFLGKSRFCFFSELCCKRKPWIQDKGIIPDPDLYFEVVQVTIRWTIHTVYSFLIKLKHWISWVIAKGIDFLAQKPMGLRCPCAETLHLPDLLWLSSPIAHWNGPFWAG